MPCSLLIRGGEIELDESEKFNKIRHRLNRARKMSEDYKNGAIDGKSEGQKFEPFHLLTFKTADGGRFSGDIENVFAVLSDELKDGSGGNDTDDEEYEDDDE